MTNTDQTFNIRDINHAQLVNMGGTVNQIYQLPPRDQNPIFTRDEHPHTDLIRAVHNVYVRGVLEDALRRVNPGFEIKLRSDPSTAGASAPYQHYQIAGNIRQIFTDIDRKLLILGEPASGKTVLLLQLTEALLQEAANNTRARIPVVVNLSSWAVKREPLDKWLIEELRRVYGASRKLSRDLIGGNRLIYMLDGLDEVAQVYRDDCLDAINSFIGPDTHITICSRITEYNAMVGKLAINSAIELQPLERDTFQKYLIDGGLSAEVAAELTDTLTADAAVWQQTRRPLFANVLIDTYADRTFIPPTSADADALDRVYEIAVAPYITRQLDRADKPYPDDKTRHYIAWMAWQMNKREMTSFYGEALQISWLHRPQSSVTFRILSVLVVGMGVELDIQKRLSLRADTMLISLPLILIIALGSGLAVGLFVLVFGLFTVLVGRLVGEGSWLTFGLNIGLSEALSQALIGGLLTGLAFGMFGLLLGMFSTVGESSVSDRARLNQGLIDTLVVGLVVGPFFGPFVGLVVVLFVWQSFGPFFGLIVILVTALLGGLAFGGFAVLRHLALRAVLHHTGQFPFNMVRFLHYTAALNLTRQVGGGMMFKHRYFQDYFAAQYERHYLAKDRGEAS